MLRSYLSVKEKFVLNIYCYYRPYKKLEITNRLYEKQILDQANKITEINHKIKMNQHIQDQKIIKLIMTVLT
jgi:hypothetical protein